MIVVKIKTVNWYARSKMNVRVTVSLFDSAVAPSTSFVHSI